MSTTRRTGRSPSATAGDDAVVLVCDLRLFPVEAVFATAYQAVERWYVHLERDTERSLRVTLRPKEGTLDTAGRRRAEGEFRNGLLDQALRLRVAEATRNEREQILARAFASQEADPFLASSDFADDPLGIAVPWEERFGAAARATPPAAPSPGARGPGKRRSRTRQR